MKGEIYEKIFVFDCAINDRKFYIPKEGEMRLQFFHVKDLCKLMEIIVETKPDTHVMNVGNPDSVTIKEWVTMCYACLDKKPVFVNVYEDIEQRKYFSFYDYEYFLDVGKQQEILPQITDLSKGLRECYEWYVEHEAEVMKKKYIQYIDENLRG